MTEEQQQQQKQQQPPPPPRKAPQSSTWSLTRIPTPLQHLFDRFPLLTYPPNELPQRSPGAHSLPTLHVFVSEQDAATGSPSFNPSCLKWQTFLRIAGVQVRIVPSTNHASPSGALPFLTPASSISLPQDPTDRVAAAHPVPSSKLYQYALDHGASRPGEVPSLRLEAYQSLLDHRIRNAWLYALYLSPRNAGLVARLYTRPASSAAPVQTALLWQLRRAAAAEILRSTGAATVEPARLYAEARDAFAALETLLARDGDGGGGGEGEGGDRWWFFGCEGGPTLFDAAVFSYTYLILHAAWSWQDDTLREILVPFPNLVAHTRRILEAYWQDQEWKWTRLYHKS